MKNVSQKITLNYFIRNKKQTCLKDELSGYEIDCTRGTEFLSKIKQWDEICEWRDVIPLNKGADTIFDY